MGEIYFPDGIYFYASVVAACWLAAVVAALTGLVAAKLFVPFIKRRWRTR